MDKEMIDMFVGEVKEIRGELAGYLSQMVKPNVLEIEASCFESYGQAIDRIYGTAATLGYPEIADYCLAIKEVSYMASQSENEKGIKKVVRMLIENLQIMEELCTCLYDPAAIKNFKTKLLVEVKRVERMNKQEFYSINKKSCA